MSRHLPLRLGDEKLDEIIAEYLRDRPQAIDLGSMEDLRVKVRAKILALEAGLSNSGSIREKVREALSHVIQAEITAAWVRQHVRSAQPSTDGRLPPPE